MLLLSYSMIIFFDVPFLLVKVHLFTFVFVGYLKLLSAVLRCIFVTDLHYNGVLEDLAL